MKQCRFCDADIPYYGGDTCSACLIKMGVEYLDKALAKYKEEKEKENG